MTSAIDRATEKIYNEISKPQYGNICGKYYQLPINSIDNIKVSCEFYHACRTLGFRIEIRDTHRTYDVNSGDMPDFKTNIMHNKDYPITDAINTKLFIKDILSELPHYKFNKNSSRFVVPDKYEDINEDIFELFKDVENLKLNCDICPCCLEPCNWNLTYTCEHPICIPCYQRLPYKPDDDGDEQKTCPTCRGNCIKFHGDEDDE